MRSRKALKKIMKGKPMYKTDDKCLICGIGSLEKTVREETFEYKGESLTVPDYVVYRCPSCEEGIVDKNTLRDTEKVIRDFHREVDGLLTSKEIKKIRTSLGFTQEAMGGLLGGGEKSFARYETGRVTQTKAMDNLLRILDTYPFILDVIMTQPAKGMKGKDSETVRYNLRPPQMRYAIGTI